MRLRLQVETDFICEHGMPQPWATCTECMLLPYATRPQPPAAKPRPKPEPKKRASRTKNSAIVRSRSGSSQAVTPRHLTRLPKSDTDELPELFGDKDLIYEVPEDNLRFHRQGPDSHWLPISSMPKELRPNGFVYLVVDDRAVSRCRVIGVGFRTQRWSHEGPSTTSDLGPGATLELYRDGWESVAEDLTSDGEQVSGYRYLTPRTQKDKAASH